MKIEEMEKSTAVWRSVNKESLKDNLSKTSREMYDLEGRLKSEMEEISEDFQEMQDKTNADLQNFQSTLAFELRGLENKLETYAETSKGMFFIDIIYLYMR